MSKKPLISKIIKSVPPIISFTAICLASMPASAAQLIEPFELLNIDSNAIDSSEVTSMNPPPSPFNNQGNPNSPNSNNSGGGGGGGGGGSNGSNNSGGGNGGGVGGGGSNGSGGSSSPFVSSQSSPDSYSNNSSGGTEINDIIPSGFNEGFADLIPQPSQINDLITVASMLQPDGNEPDGTSDNPSTDNPGGDDPGTVTPTATAIPEPTSVTALAMIGLMGVLAKQNRSDRS